MKELLTVKFFSVENQAADVESDSVLLPVSDDINGGFSGSYGIRKGHAKAVFSLKAGKVVLSEKGKVIFSANISEGFATVENNVVCITVSSMDE